MLDIPTAIIRVPETARLTTCCINGVGSLIITARQLEQRIVDMRFTTAHLPELKDFVQQLENERAARLADNARRAEAIAQHHSHIDVKG